MKKLIILFLISLICGLVSAQWDDCPFGMVNDTYPGDCNRYIDSDKDDICDRSQPPPEERGTTTVSLENGAGGKIVDENPKNAEESKASVLVDRYNAIPISIVMVFLFIFTELAVKKGSISVIGAKYIWNAILAASFVLALFASIPSIFPVIKIGVAHLWWHVESAILMSWIVIYHMWGRMQFYIRCFPKGDKKCDING